MWTCSSFIPNIIKISFISIELRIFFVKTLRTDRRKKHLKIPSKEIRFLYFNIRNPFPICSDTLYKTNKNILQLKETREKLEHNTSNLKKSSSHYQYYVFCHVSNYKIPSTWNKSDTYLTLFWNSSNIFNQPVYLVANLHLINRQA